jgi:hypothetical protein
MASYHERSAGYVERYLGARVDLGTWTKQQYQDSKLVIPGTAGTSCTHNISGCQQASLYRDPCRQPDDPLASGLGATASADPSKRRGGG